MKRAISLLFAILCITFVAAQDFSFGKVSKAELSETQHPLEAEANAAMLYNKIHSQILYIQNQGFLLETTVHRRIKIYNKEGFEWANHEIRLFRQNSTREKVTGIKGYTFNLVDGKLKKTKLRKDGIFTEHVTDNVDLEKITMPDIKEGSVIEYEYKFTSPYVGNINEYNFQYSIPLNKISVTFEAPSYYKFKKHYKGYYLIKPKETASSRQIVLRSKTREEGYLRASRTSFNEDRIDVNYSISEFNLENVPALKEEKYVSNIENYRSTVKFELIQVEMPNQPIQTFARSWDDIVKTIYRSENFGYQLDRQSYFKDDIDALIAGESNPMVKAAKIYNYVQNKVKWNGNYGKYTDVGVRKAYKEKTGNVADMNLMLTSMLRYAGIQANPVLLSTRQHGIHMFPTLNGFNYVITAIEIENAVILLDATNYYGEPNVLPMRALNWIGRLVRENGSWTQISLMPENSAVRTTTMNITLDDSGDIEGKQRTQFTSHNALSFRNIYASVDEEDYLEKLENAIGDIEIEEYSVKNVTSIGKPILESYAFSKEGQAEIIGDKIYFSPLLYLATTENPFKAEKRIYPVDFGYPWKRKVMMNINIPEGYEVESLPEIATVRLPDNLGSYAFKITKTPTGISVVIAKEINSAVIPSDKYPSLRELYKILVEKEQEKVVLKKI
ncbi:transglutaminase domain-containing protein [Kordia jejudonensis]|uniref:transglutaminase domain-containing protein n=1 Tax=Kordia jejudonensis TaxID=1348245 RepID=UPI000629AFC8|nr:transglutaminase domain-containing protein [Kordia jejudonensis]